MGRGPNTATVPHPIERQTLCASSLGLVESSLPRLASRDPVWGPREAGLWFPMDLMDPSTVSAINSLLTQYTVKGTEGLGHTPVAAAAKLLQSWLTLCDPIDGSPPGSAIPGILQERTLQWGAISFSTA